MREYFAGFYFRDFFTIAKNAKFSTNKVVNFVNITNYASLLVMELNVSETITFKGQNHSFMPDKYASKAVYQTLQIAKKNFEKLSG